MVLEDRAVPASMYDIAWLGTTGPDDNASEAAAINDLGQVVGISYILGSDGVSTDVNAVLFNPDQEPVDLGTLDGNASYAWDINNSGTIAGWYHFPSGGGYYEWAALWNNGVGETISGYDLLGGHSRAFAVNDSGLVVGNADVAGAAPRSEAFVYDGTDLTFLGTLGGQWSYAMDISGSGYIAGFADTGENPSGQPGVYMSRYHAVIWTPDGTIIDLGTLGEDSWAYKINAGGQVVGSSVAADGYYHAFFFDGTQMIDIGPAESNTQALAINDAGQIVGDTVNWHSSTAFLYEDGAMYDLNTLAIGLGTDVIMSASDINNAGQIVGYGLHNGKYRAFVLTPSGQSGPVTPPPTDPAPPPSDPVATDPTATISGPTDGFQGVTGQERTVVLGGDGSLAADGFEFRVEWGDGTYDTLNGASGITATHVYDAVGSYTVTVTATDSDAVVSDPVTLVLNILAVEQQGDVLAIGGTAADDVVTVAAGAATGTVDTALGTFATSQVLVYGHKGSDDVLVLGTASNDTFVINPDSVDVNGVIVRGSAVENWAADGRAGADVFWAIGAGLPAALQGGDGDDVFQVAAAASFTGAIDGGAGIDVLDYSIHQAAVTVNLANRTASATAGFTSVEGFIGSNSFADALIGADPANAWTLTDYDTGTVNALAFRSFENLTGGSGADTFKINPLTAVYGVIDGGAGVNTLDYSAFATAIAVNLSAGSATGANTAVARIANVIGGAGADTIVGDAGNNVLLGNAGNDVLDGGPGGNDVLVGGAGADTLRGSAGRNILIGGLGADVLSGGGGEDILIGGTTSHDTKLAALTALMAEWGRTDQTYQERIDHLTGARTGGANGTVYLKTKTVKDDKTADRISGGNGLDWFWGLAAEIIDLNTGERRN